MSDRTALILGGIILAAITLDLLLGGPVTLFLLRRLAAFVEWLQFWR